MFALAFGELAASRVLYYFSSSSFNPCSRCCLPNVPGVHTHGHIFTILFALMSRSTRLIIHSISRFVPPF